MFVAALAHSLLSLLVFYVLKKFKWSSLKGKLKIIVGLTKPEVASIKMRCYVFQGSFQQMWISKQEYNEQGKCCVERKCP